MKNIRIVLTSLSLCMMSLSVLAQDNLVAATNNGTTDNFKFTVVKKLPITPIKNQASSSTCWSYSGLGFVESEMLRMGKPAVDLAEMFVVYKTYQAKADRFVRLHGNITFSPGAICADVLDVIARHGAVPQEVYESLNSHYEMDDALRGYVDGVVAQKLICADWKKGFNRILDAYLGELPQEFTYQGKKYTPSTFAQKVVGINPADYTYITSWMDSPYYQKMDLLVPDNWDWEKFYNVPLDEMISTIDNALEKGYTIAWATDVSEKGFSSKIGVALVLEQQTENTLIEPRFEKVITEKMRQKGFDNYSTQDDHGMVIFGIAKDQNGKKYYIVKNSWGEQRGRDGGLMYVSEAFMRYKTIFIIVHKDAVPATIAKKLK